MYCSTVQSLFQGKSNVLATAQTNGAVQEAGASAQRQRRKLKITLRHRKAASGRIDLARSPSRTVTPEPAAWRGCERHPPRHAVPPESAERRHQPPACERTGIVAAALRLVERIARSAVKAGAHGRNEPNGLVRHAQYGHHAGGCVLKSRPRLRETGHGNNRSLSLPPRGVE